MQNLSTIVLDLSNRVIQLEQSCKSQAQSSKRRHDDSDEVIMRGRRERISEAADPEPVIVHDSESGDNDDSDRQT